MNNDDKSDFLELEHESEFMHFYADEYEDINYNDDKDND